MHGKETEILEAREKAKIDFDKKLRLIQRDVDQNEELKSRVKQLESDLTGKNISLFEINPFVLDHRFTDRNTIRQLESRVAELETILNQRDQEVSRLRREEEQRLHFLRTAIIDYIGTDK